MPELNDVNTGETIASQWGNDIRDRTVQRYADAATRDTDHPTPTEGDLAYLQDTNILQIWTGGAWQDIPYLLIDTADIADEAITQVKLSASPFAAVGPNQLQTDAVATVKIQDLAVTNPKIGPAAVDTPELADEAVTQSKLSASPSAAVGANQLQSNAVTFVKLDGGGLAELEVDNSTEVGIYALTGSMATAASISLSIPAGWGSWKCEAWATYRTVGGTSSEYSVRIVIDGTAQQTKGPIDQDDAADTEGAIVGRRTGMTTTGSRTIVLQAQRISGTGGSLNDIALLARAVRTS